MPAASPRPPRYRVVLLAETETVAEVGCALPDRKTETARPGLPDRRCEPTVAPALPKPRASAEPTAEPEEEVHLDVPASPNKDAPVVMSELGRLRDEQMKFFLCITSLWLLVPAAHGAYSLAFVAMPRRDALCLAMLVGLTCTACLVSTLCWLNYEEGTPWLLVADRAGASVLFVWLCAPRREEGPEVPGLSRLPPRDW